MSDTPKEAGSSAPPHTGHPELDDALRAVAALEHLALAEQLGALSAAHERVNAALAAARTQPAAGQSRPGPPRPGQ